MKKDFLKLGIGLALALILYFWLGDSPPAPLPEQNIIRPEEQKLEPDILVVASLSIRVPVQYVEKVSESAFQKALQGGVVHYPGTALPGQHGNVYLFGHSSDNAWAKGDFKTVFASLPQIEVGAEIILTDRQGEIYRYYVTDKIIASPRDVHYLEQGDRSRRILTLQTSYPVGTSLRRYIVRAEMR